MNRKSLVTLLIVLGGAGAYFLATLEARYVLTRYEQHYVCSDRSLNYYLSSEVTNWHYGQREFLSQAIATNDYFGMPAGALNSVHDANTERKSKIDYNREATVKEFKCLELWQERTG